MQDDEETGSTTKVKQQRIPGKYPKLTPLQLKEVSKGVNPDALIAGVVQRQKQVLKHVRDKYTQDAKPVFYDKGE